MRQELQVELAKRVHAHIEAKTTDTDPRGTTVGIGAYANDARIALENAILFRKLPLPIAHLSDVPNAGDFLTHDASGRSAPRRPA